MDRARYLPAATSISDCRKWLLQIASEIERHDHCGEREGTFNVKYWKENGKKDFNPKKWRQAPHFSRILSNYFFPYLHIHSAYLIREKIIEYISRDLLLMFDAPEEFCIVFACPFIALLIKSMLH